MNKVLNKQGIKAVFLFIAELNGFKLGNTKAKVHYGVKCWLSNTLHELTYEPTSTNKEEIERAEDDRAEAHENIWLERVYAGLDNHFNITSVIKTKALSSRDALKYIAAKHSASTYNFNVPLELDASASMLQYMGVLLNDKRLMSMTNVIGKELSDPWAFDGIPRKQFKKAATPMLYGSSKACHELWQDGGFDYTLEQVELFTEEINSGAFGVANALKEFIITNCKPKAEMKVCIGNNTFTVECNRFRNVGDHTDTFRLYDSESNSMRTFHHTVTKKVPDLEQFRRYFVTLLIHNLDSQVADKVISKVMDKYGWGIDIHDAFIVHPNAARDVRKWYKEELEHLYSNRNSVLTNYFQSIGIGKEAANQWEQVLAKVQQADQPVFSPMALK